MNVAKNMEAIFILVIALIGITSLATVAVPAQNGPAVIAIAQ
ncbi:MAG: hypothetical protein V4463_17280 [Pseudomonadota bacterium]